MKTTDIGNPDVNETEESLPELNIKCPECGGNIHFDEGSKSGKCSICPNVFAR